MSNTTMMRSLRCLGWRTVATLMAVIGLAQVSQAATSAYWRHEEGSSGGVIAAGPGSVLDSSGNTNHMQTFDPTFTSATYSTNVSPLALQSGLPNTLSLDFGPGGDDAGQNDDNYSGGAAVNAQPFTSMTVELAFNMDSIGGYQAIFGKDGKPTASVVPPFKVLIRGDDFPNAIPNQLFIEWIDGDGDVHFLAGGKTIAAGEWNHLAFTLTDSTASLYVAGEDTPYQLLSTITGADFAGTSGEVLFASDANYSVGRGAFNGGVADWSNALIDEVRISNTALTPSGFLFAAVPEPSSMLLVVLGAAAFGTRGVRKV
jgi:hypothetical protein